MTAVEIPLIPSPQTLSIALNGVTYGMRLIYRGVAGWILDLLDASNNPLACGIPLVTGCDLLAPFPALDVGGSLYVQSDASPDAVPGFADLGVTSHLLLVTP